MEKIAQFLGRFRLYIKQSKDWECVVRNMKRYGLVLTASDGPMTDAELRRRIYEIVDTTTMKFRLSRKQMDPVRIDIACLYYGLEGRPEMSKKEIAEKYIIPLSLVKSAVQGVTYAMCGSRPYRDFYHAALYVGRLDRYDYERLLAFVKNCRTGL